MSNISKIIRGRRPQDNFYILDKKISEDARLSWEARGVLIFLLGKPDNWKVSVAHLISVGSAKRDKMYRIINELMEAGYFTRTKGPKGHGCDYVISEVPLTENTEVEKPLTEKPLTEKPFPSKTTLVSTEYKQELNTNNNKSKQKKSALDWSQIQLTEKQKDDISGIRLAAKARLTQRALDTIIKEFHLAAQFGIDYDESIDIWAVRGWKAYKADWALNHKGTCNANRSNGQSTAPGLDLDSIDY